LDFKEADNLRVNEDALSAWRCKRAATSIVVPAFQKIPDHRGIVLNDPIGASAHLQLSRAYALQGDSFRVRAAYPADNS